MENFVVLTVNLFAQENTENLLLSLVLSNTISKLCFSSHKRGYCLNRVSIFNQYLSLRLTQT